MEGPPALLDHVDEVSYQSHVRAGAPRLHMRTSSLLAGQGQGLPEGIHRQNAFRSHDFQSHVAPGPISRGTRPTGIQSAVYPVGQLEGKQARVVNAQARMQQAVANLRIDLCHFSVPEPAQQINHMHCVVHHGATARQFCIDKPASRHGALIRASRTEDGA